ncbi:hypothetical protein AAF712_001966 [Marasmius tenuissimus]|uniref:FAD-binding PCMH-type domain-containing protein n=1 Tax=Marasmius tenuissimus TaxID=585030 RepID=A0ABR3AB62_9AGAR|nr:hypothetical protein PM082_005476 [Marasmius tenuissimus]
MIPRLLLSLVALAATLPARAETKCKCLPGDACFPDENAWKALQQNLSTPLIVGQRPLASVCYENDANFNAGACSSLTENQFNGHLRSRLSNALQWTNWEEVITADGVQNCPFEPQPNATCYQGRVPSYSVNVTKVEDIQNTVRFATEHNLHLVVKNQGHENLGRAFGVGSVEIFVGLLTGYEFHDSFVPEGAPEGTEGLPGVTIQPGVQWGDLYALSAERNRTVVGGIGAGGTVGAGGGWPLGGGHGILSPYYGLGVDNVMQFTIVLPNASHVTVNDYNYPDIFWALRGGGGPNFGVLTSLTYKTHPNPPFTAAFYVAQAADDDAYFSIFETFNKHHNAIADAGWAGFWPFNNRTFYLTLITPGLPPTGATANATLEDFYADVKKISNVDVSLQITADYNSFEHWYHDNFIDSSKGFGFNYTVGDAGGIRVVVSSWLIPRDVFDTNPTELAQAWMKMPVGRPFMVGGGAVAAFDGSKVSATPAWRRTISDMTVANEYESDATPEQIQALREDVYNQIEPLRQLAPAPHGGQYMNEPDVLEKNPQEAYWGENYPRLLAIKKEVDPNDLFILQLSVNSEGWDENVVCKTT